MRSPVNAVLPLAALSILAGLAGLAGPAYGAGAKPAPEPSGPAADYPVVLGDGFSIGGQSYTPVDKLNYDEVGQAAIGSGDGEMIWAAHKTLPLPSYVEVTSLVSGRTILVRVQRRGPMSNDQLIELSPAAAEQLGMAPAGQTAVRVRRVNPPEPERALLRTGQRVPERMATPKGLLDALNRKLARQPLENPALKTTSAAPVLPRPAVKPATPRAPYAPAPAPATTAPRSAPSTRAEAPGSALIVQVAAFSTKQRAEAAAGKLGAVIAPAGRLWRVRVGPLGTRAQAEAALAKVRSAGYSDARIQPAD